MVAAVRDALSESHRVLGDLGRRENAERALLVRVRADNRLEVALLHAADHEGSMDLTLLGELDAKIPASEIPCPFCGRPLRVWGRFCTRCGKDLAGISAASIGLTAEQMMVQVRELAGNAYEVLGAMPRREGGGEVYFARESASGGLVALRLEAQSGSGPVDRRLATQQERDELLRGRYTLGVTAVVRAVPATPPPPSRESVPRRRSRVSRRSAAAPTDLLAALQEETAGEFEVFGEMARLDASLFFLARELASSDLIALRLFPDGEAYSLEVHRRLDRRVGAESAICAGCGSLLGGAVDRCGQCGRPLSSGGRTARERDDERARLRQLSSATNGDYEFIGEMERSSDDSVVYFARRTSDRTIVGVRCARSKSFGDENAMSIKETGIASVIEDHPVRVPVHAAPEHAPRPVDAISEEPPPTPRIPPLASPRQRPSFSAEEEDNSGKAALVLRIVFGALGMLVLVLVAVATVRSCN